MSLGCNFILLQKSQKEAEKYQHYHGKIQQVSKNLNLPLLKICFSLFINRRKYRPELAKQSVQINYILSEKKPSESILCPYYLSFFLRIEPKIQLLKKLLFQ